MELIEKVDLRATNYLATITFEKFKQYINWDCNMDEKKKMFDNFKQFCKFNIKSKGEIKRLYAYTLNTPNEVGGRLFCGGSVQGLPRDIRGCIMKHTTDIDMINAHPTILRYLCRINNIACPNLSYFCENREHIFKSISEDKEYCKKIFLKALNSEKINRTEKNKLFRDFDKECKTIQIQLCNNVAYKHIVDCVHAGKLFNWYGSAINRILCSYENKILQEIINLIHRKSIEIAVLMFDGLMVYGNYYDDINLLNEIEERINKVFEGLDMRLAYKEHSYLIEIPDDYTIPTQKETINAIEINSFDKVCEEFEKTHCKIINTSSFITELDNQIIVMNRTQLKTSYEHLTYEEINFDKNGEHKIIKKSFIDDWLKYEKIRRYKSIGIYPPPLNCPIDEYNLWKPFDMEYITEYEPKEEALQIFLKHIKILCGNDEHVFQYIIKWVGQMIKYPAIKTICPTLISKEGAGKGTLIKLMRKMLGSEKVFETTRPSRDVWGDFNGCMANTFLVNLNELSKKETSESMNYIKGLITDDDLTINNKGVSQYKIQSYHRFIITTNNDEPINTTKDDRRKLIIRSSDELIGNKDYFTKINDELLTDVNVIKTCYEYFKNLDGLDKFLSIPLPITEYQEDLKMLDINYIEEWVKYYVNEFDLDEGEDNIVQLSSIEVYKLFSNWISNNGYKYELNNVQFAVRLKRLNITGICVKHTKKGNITIFNIPMIKQHV